MDAHADWISWYQAFLLYALHQPLLAIHLLDG